jgi:hypothetical protein
VVLIIKSTKEILRGGQRSGNGENIRRQYPLQISENIPTIILMIATLMATLRKSVGNYIHGLT